MKKFVYLATCCLISMTGSAQLVKQKAEKINKQSEMDWFNCSFDEDSVYGAEVNKAYEYLTANKKKAKKRPVVAMIGGGMDVEHEDLKHAIWVNRKEKPNQKDDDKNGLVDDINGWNFIGGKDNQVMESLMREGDREFFRLKDKYTGYIFDGKKYYKIIDGKRQEVPAPDDLEMYRYYRHKITPESPIAEAYNSLQFSYVIQEYMDKFEQQMKQKFPNQELTMKEFQTCYDPKAERDSISDVVYVFAAYAFSIYRTDKWEIVREKMKKSATDAVNSYNSAMKRYSDDHRKEIVGDDPMDINDTHYGNNVLLTSDAASEILKAGVIAAKRDNGIGSNGIADNAEIMTLRVHPGKGEPYLKDIALAIRYAVAHGADIITLPEQNSLYPEPQRQWVADALKEAEKKGVLVIVPVWDLSRDMDKEEFFPNRKMTKDSELTNLMVVASSDEKGNPVMNTNYGATTVDLYAPGTNILSSYMGDTYQKATGEGLATATVAGVAALLKTYFPKLTGSQLRDILLKSVTSRKGVEVEKGIIIKNKPSQDLFLFDDLCIAGGIVNAYQAILEAEKVGK